MSLSPERRVGRRKGVVAEGLPLSPAEYFVLTCVDQARRVAELARLSGLGAEETSAAVARLLELGAVELLPEDPAENGGARRDPLGDRTRRMLRAQFEAFASQPLGAERKDRVADAPEPEPEAESEPDDPVFVFPTVAVDDPRIDPASAVVPDEQRILFALADRMFELSHYEILGLRPTADPRIIRRAYHAMSRRLHPDSYYGRDVGSLRDTMAKLFDRARRAYDTLADPDKRKQHLSELLAAEPERAPTEDPRRVREALEQEARRRAAEAEQRRVQEDRMRQLRERFDPAAARRKKADGHYQQGQQAKDQGNMAAAANFFRLAMDLDPSRKEYHQLWQSCLGVARSARAETAFAKAMRLIDLGHGAEAAHLLVEAAEANPTAEHLSYAAEAVAGADPPKARAYALRALDALAMAEAMGQKWTDEVRVQLHLRVARAFVAAGQLHTAAQQVEEVRRRRPDHPELDALLKAAKLT